ncbi:hypothetical protein TNCV_1749241 [Trichonephila clavipes]|nr:hypothetical protein TNCV_1749241 [Trichonephila clavipes]
MSDSCRLRRGLPFAPHCCRYRDSAKFSDGFSFPTPCFLFLRYGAVAMRLETHKFFGLKMLEEDWALCCYDNLKLLEEDQALLLREFGNVGLGLGVNFLLLLLFYHRFWSDDPLTKCRDWRIARWPHQDSSLSQILNQLSDNVYL